MGVGKPRGIKAGRKLKDHRRLNRLILFYIIGGLIKIITKL